MFLIPGNWSEELDQYAANMKAFLEQKRAGTLKTDMCGETL